jgi:S-adenosylmethionine:tRNA ribosyltransferase-isomerase
MKALENAGHELAYVTLHVGPGTFAPLQEESFKTGQLHEERFHVPEATVTAVARTRAEQRPVVAVGTTVVRTLETAACENGELRAGSGRTPLFIYPPYSFRVVDALLTNFHVPKSSLLALVMAFAGVDNVRGAYEAAIRERYRFFSYGDAMLIKPHGSKR